MNRVKSEGDLGILQVDSMIDSPSFDEESSGGSGMGCGSGLKKGPWTSAEDSILVEYVKKHGEGNWNAVQKNTGLSRCGKSCRLRWANHLRPNLKKGAFSSDEEKLIIELHAKLGNKWARMAAYLPGRTDNEIKNYWNTRLKRCQRAGLPVYPSSLCYQLSSSEDQFPDFCQSRKRNPSDFLEDSISGFYIPDSSSSQLDSSSTLSFSAYPDYSVNNIIMHGFGYQNYIYGGNGNVNNNGQNQVRRRSLSESPLSAITETFNNDGLPSLEIVPSNSVESFRKVLDFSSSDDLFESSILNNNNNINININNNNNNNNDENNNNTNNTNNNINISASGLSNNEIITSGKMELPSLQDTETETARWLNLQQQNPIQSESTGDLQSVSTGDRSSPYNSGLLEDLVYEAEAISTGKRKRGNILKSCGSSSRMLDLYPLFLDGSKSDECGLSLALVNNNTDQGSFGNFLACEESQGLDAVVRVRDGKSKNNDNVLEENNMLKCETLNDDDSGKSESETLIRPDALLGSSWIEERSEMVKNRTVFTEAVSALMGVQSV